MTFQRLIGFAWPYRVRLAVCTALMLLETAAALVVPWLGGQFAAGIVSSEPLSIGTISIGLIAVFGALALLQVVRGAILASTSQRILANLRTKLYDHLQLLPLSFFHQRRQGDILALLTYEIEQLSGYLTGTFLRLVPLFLTVIGALILMMRIDPVLALPVVIGIPFFTLSMKIIGRRLRPLAGNVREAYAKSVAIAEENLSMLPAIKSFTRETRESERHAFQVNKVRSLNTEMAIIQAMLGPAMQFVAAASLVVLLWITGDRFLSGDMNSAELVSFLLYAALLTRPVAGLADAWGQTQLARGTLARLGDVLDEAPELASGGLEVTAVRGNIAFEGVQFAYADRSPALYDVKFVIKAGETVALTGKNGAGKTTIVDLLLRFFAPSDGRITLDGIDIQSLNLECLRRNIGVVPQQVLLFDGTVRSNIKFGNPNATNVDIERAARLAQAESFISDLPDGYDTLIGDKGVRLSGGQRQRIALARALVKDPPILVLDEPTAMFDPEGEQSFVVEARESFANRTVILITHRPASLALADRIITLVAGRVVSARRNGKDAAAANKTGDAFNLKAGPEDTVAAKKGSMR